MPQQGTERVIAVFPVPSARMKRPRLDGRFTVAATQGFALGTIINILGRGISKLVVRETAIGLMPAINDRDMRLHSPRQ